MPSSNQLCFWKVFHIKEMQQLFLSQLVKGLPSNNMWKQIENLDANFFFFFSTWKTWLSIISFFDITYKCLLFAWEDSLYKDLPNEWCGLTNTMIYLDTWNLHGNIPMKRKDGSKNRLKAIQPIVNWWMFILVLSSFFLIKR